MEITRRNFVQFLVGGAAGIHMTPLPWKLMDDIAIWTQNWPWVPVPTTGRFHHEKSVCGLCPGGCGIEVRKVDERAVKIEGRTDYPVNPGGICPLGAGGLQLLYDETIRFTGPMKRVGPRGAGEFADISWKEALETVAGRIAGLRSNDRPEALAAVDGNRRWSTMSLLVRRLLEAVGSPNYMRMPTIEDTYAVANMLMQGTEGPMAYDMENSDFILSFGCALIEGWGAPGRVIDAWGRRHQDQGKKAPRVVQVESRASDTASKADAWVTPRPGTEAALALGIAHVLISEDLVDGSFLSNHTHGYHDWTGPGGGERRGFKSMVLEKYPPDEVEKITGVKAERIVSLARDFGRSRSPMAMYGKGKGDLNGSLLECMAVQSLNALKGNINKPGGVIVQEPLPLKPWRPVEPDPAAAAGLARGRVDGAGRAGAPFTESLPGDFAAAVLAEEGPAVDTLLIFASNPAYNLPGGVFRKALEKIPFIVSFSPFQDETAAMADLILPDQTCLEKLEEVVWPVGLQYPMLGLSKPVVRPVYATRHAGDTVIAMAKKIGPPVSEAFPWKGFEPALRERVEGLMNTAGLTSWDRSTPPWEGFARGRAFNADYKDADELWDKLREGGLWYRPTHDFFNWFNCFKTPTGKLELASSRMEEALTESSGKDLGLGAGGDEALMPHYEEIGGERGEELLTLVPYELFNVSTGWLPNPPFLTKTLFDHQLRKDESFVEINPETARRLGLAEGDRVRLETGSGDVGARVHLFEGAMPGCAYLPMGFGHTAYGIYQKGKGVNPMDVVVPVSDPVSGHMVWWKTPVKVRKA